MKVEHIPPVVIAAPPSKSYGVRAVVASMLSGCGRVEHEAEHEADDIRAAVRASAAFAGGDTVIDVGESALAANIFACLAALDGREITITGRGTLLGRPLNLAPLRDLGVYVSGDKIPLTVRGPLRGGRVKVDASTGSQAVTGLLMALPLAVGDSVVMVENPRSIPYIYITLDVLSRFGIEVERDDWEFRIAGGRHYVPAPYVVEGDWSGASCVLVAGAFSAAGVTVEGLSSLSLQGDKAIVDALGAAGAHVVQGVDRVFVRRPPRLRAFEFDASDCPDLFPALVALAAACEGESVIRGAWRLRYKESSRGEVLVREYAKIGIEAILEGNLLRVCGGMPRGALVSGHGDHRVVMSLAVSGLRACGDVIVENAECVAKSYPQFWKDYEYFRQQVQDYYFW